MSDEKNQMRSPDGPLSRVLGAMESGVGVPNYWRYEASGLLAPVVETYLNDRPLTSGQITVLKMYLRQWIMAPVWRGDVELEALRYSVEQIRTQQDITDWLARALDEGHDPL